MTRDEIVTALRCCAKGLLSECPNCKMYDEANCIVKLKTAAADLIENQRRHIEALMKANDSLKDAIARWVNMRAAFRSCSFEEFTR